MGRIVIVVGPSGAGKDSIIGKAKQHFADNQRIRFVRRIITRPCDPKAEIHDSVTESEFSQMEAAGAFAAVWRANDLSYALPASTLDDINNDYVLVANGSRAALPELRSVYPQLTAIHITADPDILAQRLSRRRRESAVQIQKRLSRNAHMGQIHGDVVEIDNSAEPSVAELKFVAVLNSLL